MALFPWSGDPGPSDVYSRLDWSWGKFVIVMTPTLFWAALVLLVAEVLAELRRRRREQEES